MGGQVGLLTRKIEASVIVSGGHVYCYQHIHSVMASITSLSNDAISRTLMRCNICLMGTVDNEISDGSLGHLVDIEPNPNIR